MCRSSRRRIELVLWLAYFYCSLLVATIVRPTTAFQVIGAPPTRIRARRSSWSNDNCYLLPRWTQICLTLGASEKDEDGPSPSSQNIKRSKRQQQIGPKTPSSSKSTSSNVNKRPLGSNKTKSQPSRRFKKQTKQQRNNNKQTNKQELVKAVGEQMKAAARAKKETERESSNRLLDRINPFKAGQSLRQTINTALTSMDKQQRQLSSPRDSIYYLDDRFVEDTQQQPKQQSSYDDDDEYVPEVLVVGATGAVGRLVVQQLVRNTKPRVRVRVLVCDLYTQTLNMLGAGVTYCQGDLANVDSLEYAVTDVDKIVFCAAPPRPDEDQFRSKFQQYLRETNLETPTPSIDGTTTTSSGQQPHAHTDPVQLPEPTKTTSDLEWEQMEAVLKMRAALAEQVDCVGMQNVVNAWLNVRHADYGTSQAAKRSLFKFEGRPEDFNLFAIAEEDDSDDVDNDAEKDSVGTAAAKQAEGSDSEGYKSKGGNKPSGSMSSDYYAEDEDYDDYEEYPDDEYEDIYGDFDDEDDEFYENGETTTTVEQRRDAAVKTQSRWLRNQFGHGVFVGRIPKSTADSSVSISGEAAIVSSRLRSREEPDSGIELGPGFAGLICRVCSDGGTYEAFVRTRAYYEDGIEYVCEFSTSTKVTSAANKSRNKFTTVRLPFENFKPVQSKSNSDASLSSVPPFRGRDVRNIGFRYRSSRNEGKSKVDKKGAEWNRFYLSLSYIKLYRSQPEPEFVYLSDARIPPVVRDGMVRHEARQLLPATAAPSNSAKTDKSEIRLLLDESTMAATANDPMGRSPEETYYKYRGEEILKGSGLSYAIVRISGFNESPTGEASTIDLTSGGLVETSTSAGASTLTDAAVSRADVAQVCVGALLDPHALNKSFYVGKKKVGRSLDEDMSAKFAALPKDEIA